MKNEFSLPLLTLFGFLFLFSCNTNETPIKDELNSAMSYIINYGSYSGDKSTITAYDNKTDLLSNGYYKQVNGVDMVSNVQHAEHFNDKIYFMGNNADQVFWVDDETFIQSENAITDGIIKPRFGIGNGNYLYVSCWGGNIWEDTSLSYIAKINVTTNEVEETIELPGGPEGLAISNNKLYAALNYKDSVAVINLASSAISYIETPAVTSFFVKDNQGNLYVSLLNTFSKPSEKDGIAYINTSKDEVVASYPLSGVSSSYVNILAQSDDFSKLYVMTSAYDENWNLSGAVAVFDTQNKTFESEPLVAGISGMNGVEFSNGKVLCFVAESVTGNGQAKLYNPEGTLTAEWETGVAPFMLLDLE